MFYLTAVFNSKPMKKDFSTQIVDTVRKIITQKEHNMMYLVRHNKGVYELVHVHALISFDTFEDMQKMEDFLSSYNTRFYFIKSSKCNNIQSYFNYMHHEMTNDELCKWENETMFDRKLIFFNKKSIELFEILKKNFLMSILRVRGEKSGGFPRSETEGLITTDIMDLFIND